MKFVKALNQGIVTDLGIGQHVYNITMEGTEVQDDVASKLKEVFGHLIEVTDAPSEIDATPLGEASVEEEKLPAEGAEKVEDSTEVNTVETVTDAPEIKTDTVEGPTVATDTINTENTTPDA